MQVGQAGNRGTSSLISLVFPTYNAVSLVDHTWRQIQAFQQWIPLNWEFLFVCDGCTDGTPERLQALTHKAGDHVRVLSYQPNRGKGFAVRLGLQAARGRWRLFTDVDLAYSFADIARLAEVLQNGAEVAIASRDHKESRLLVPPRLLSYVYQRRLQSLVFGTLVRLLLPIGFGDTQAGLKGLSAEAAEILLPRLSTCGFEFDCELLTACARLGLPVTEVPVTVRYEDQASTTGLNDMTAMLRKLWTIRRNWRRVPPLALPLTAEMPKRGAA
jgi:dolichyl-phosphate beta-glucosyltransferase